MQTVTTQFNNRANGFMRPLSWSLLMSFDKTFLPSIDFFTIEVSTIGGDDIIKGEGNVIQEWDKYQYADFTGRIISFEWSRQEDTLNSLSLATADVVLDNSDGYFTPNGGSGIEDFILPYRPIKLFAGFGGENIPVFIGITEKMPEVDEKNKTVKFHCVDFLYSLFNRPLDEAVMFEDYTTDLILDELFTMAGLTSSQFVLDQGFNVIRFAYFEKGSKLGDAIRELMEAEQGRLYMDETGVIYFKNRQNFSDDPVWAFSPNNIVDLKTSGQDEIINVVELKAEVREVQELQKFWELGETIFIPAGESVDVWADFDDPVTSVDTPAYSLLPLTESFFYVNTVQDDTGETSNSDVSLDSFTAFAKSYKMTFENTGSVGYYITKLDLWATPARVTHKIYMREQDDNSVADYDERVYSLENNFIQREDEAYSKSHIILNDYADYGSVKVLDVKGNMALQLGDCIDVIQKDVGIELYIITKIFGRLQGGRFTQTLTVKQRDPQHYFTIGISTIEGTDWIAP